ncbi:MAG: N-acetylmuramoyl-L-alanine amidase [Betaproteobacteria bacterium]|nr:N-acetylmuramoyl-L-alanine amidase [Betaproteobacteria bacterium]
MSSRAFGPSSLGAHFAARLLRVLICAALLAVTPAWAAVSLIATRVWPAAEYTRVTFEARQPVKFQMQVLKDPERLVVDLEGVELTAELTDLARRVGENDPYIKSVRVGRFKPTVVRVVFDLKADVKPGIFALAPAGEYKHRVVLDIYPLNPIEPPDPLLALINNTEANRDTEAAQKPSLALKSETELKDAPPINAPPEGKPSVKTEPAPQSKSPAVQAESPQQKPQRGKKPGVARLITVVVDAGHGGEDPGARGRKGTKEKDITLTIAKRVKTMIDAEPGMRAVLTRDGDYFVALHDRVAKARKAQADIFVSIHADAFLQPRANGSSVFALSERGATSVAARWLAQRENEADLIGGVNLDVKDPYLAKTLLDLSQTATINDSLKLGKAVLGEMGEINRLHKSHVEQAGFAVLKAPDIPSILVETAFISNPEEEKKLNDPKYQDKMADAIVSGIKSYFAKNPALSRQTTVAAIK